jgi:polygalacturonase
VSRQHCDIKTLSLIVACALISLRAWSGTSNEIDIGRFGAKGDGQTDDSINVQKALSYCSRRGVTCRISANTTYLITQPLFLWGSARLQGTDGSGTLVFSAASAPYLLNIGISRKNGLETPFQGEISDVTFRVIGGPGGRIIYFWRTRNAAIDHNTFYIGNYAYSATSSGNDNDWVVNGFSNNVRENIKITGNKIYASASAAGSEGIGLADFDGAAISENQVVGVGDDPMGIHFSTHVVVNNNLLRSVHGRLFVANSSEVAITDNTVERMSSASDHKFYEGIALIYVGFEDQDSNSWNAPHDIQIRGNHLYYPPGALDQGAAINLNGVKATTVEDNEIVNDSPSVIATGLHVSPVLFSGPWHDPEGIEVGSIASVWDIDIQRNKSGGKHPQNIIMTGNCANYKGRITVQENVAQDFTFYCDNTEFREDRNTRLGKKKT